MQQVTLKPGDYVATEGMTENDYHAVARAFMNAGARRGEYPDNRYLRVFECIGWYAYNVAVWHQDARFFNAQAGRLLTVNQVLSATNAGNAAPPSPMNCRCVMTPIIKETDMHITDKLHKARKERDEAQANYEQVLAEHRSAYPWLVIEERTEPAEDMTNPRNWREGDWLECKSDAHDLTGGRLYQMLSKDGANDPVIDDDADEDIARPAQYFRFHSRP